MNNSTELLTELTTVEVEEELASVDLSLGELEMVSGGGGWINVF